MFKRETISTVTTTGTIIARGIFESRSEISLSEKTSIPDDQETTSISKLPIFDVNVPRKVVNLKLFYCTEVIRGFYCFSADFPFCVYGEGRIPDDPIVRVRALLGHTFDFCTSKVVYMIESGE